jgi:uncharacterized protein
MNIDWMSPTIGGLLIGLAASLLLLLQGRIFGVTGILAKAMFEKAEARKVSFAIIAGLVVGPLFINFLNPSFFDYEVPSSHFLMALAGLFVGFGTRLGSGCTSGHGICGLPRLSLRSLVAVCTFMGSGIVTVYLLKHIVGI